jgi:hypothetical protein
MLWLNVRSASRVITVLEPDRRTVPSPFSGGCGDSPVVSCRLHKFVEDATAVH